MEKRRELEDSDCEDEGCCAVYTCFDCGIDNIVCESTGEQWVEKHKYAAG